MKIILQLVILIIILSSCEQNTQEHKYRYQFNVKSEDTTKNYTVFSNLSNEYDFFDKKQIDSIIFNKEVLNQLNGEFAFGFTHNKFKENKLLIFFSDSRVLPLFQNKEQELQTAWLEEIKLSYPASSPKISLYASEESIHNNKPVKFYTFLITDTYKKDTLGFQEVTYRLTSKRLVTLIIFYSSQIYRNELLNLFSDFANEKAFAQKAIAKDTINFGTYYNTTIWSEMGYTSLKDDKNNVITHFKNDSTYKVKVSLTGKYKIPFRVVSLNANVTIAPMVGELDTYLCTIKKQMPEKSNKTKFNARLALIANTDSVEYYLTDNYWTDSSKIRYKQITWKIDTIMWEEFQIKDK
jgi:hypothetical protein